MFKQGDIIIRKFQESWRSGCGEFYLRPDFDWYGEYLRIRGRLAYRKSVPPCHQSKDILPDTGKAWRYARINGKWYYDSIAYRIVGTRGTWVGWVSRRFIGGRGRIGGRSRSATERELKEQVNSMFCPGWIMQIWIFYRYYEVNGVCKFNTDKAKQLAESLNLAKTMSWGCFWKAL
jgi:hypothetical protein